MRIVVPRWASRGALVSAAGLAVAAFGVPATAETGTITPVQNVYTYTAPPGGEFGVSEFSGMTLPAHGAGVAVPGSLFQTFCLEFNEQVFVGVQSLWSLGDAAHAGGQGGAVNGADPISAETAYLYTKFWTGTLTGYDTTLGDPRKASAWELQIAIWILEEELPESALPNLTFNGLAPGWIDEARIAVATGNWTGIGAVRVLTLTDAAGNPRQDLLVLTSVTPPPPPCGGGGHTPGFWGNKNGQRLIEADDLAALVALNLRNEDGSHYNPPSKSDYKRWLRNGRAVNMAYMLSVQLSAMRLNVLNGFVDGGALVYAPGCGNTGPGNGQISISDLIAAADASLAANGLTDTAGAVRSYQECLKDALDDANNNLNWVSTTCP